MAADQLIQQGSLDQLFDMTMPPGEYRIDFEVPFDVPGPVLWAVSTLLATRGLQAIDVHMESGQLSLNFQVT